jgi:hypothetical protein
VSWGGGALRGGVAVKTVISVVLGCVGCPGAAREGWRRWCGRAPGRTTGGAPLWRLSAGPRGVFQQVCRQVGGGGTQGEEAVQPSTQWVQWSMDDVDCVGCLGASSERCPGARVGPGGGGGGYTVGSVIHTAQYGGG